MIHFFFKLSIPMILKFQKTKPDALVLVKLCLPVTSINLISFIRVFVPFLCCYWLWSFFETLVFVCFLLFWLLLSLFSLLFISGQNFISSSKDVAASAAVVELIVRKITVSLLLTLAVVCYWWNCQSNKFL